jgi:hypothetical protein
MAVVVSALVSSGELKPYADYATKQIGKIPR